MSTNWPDFNDLWDYNNPSETEQVFRRMLPDGVASGDWGSDEGSYILQLKSQIGRTLGLQGRFEEAQNILDEVEAVMGGNDLVEVRYLLERGRVFNSSKRPETAVPLFLRSYEIAEKILADFYAVDALHMLGIAADTAEARREWNLKAIAYAEASEQERANNWLGTLYNNTAWGLFDEARYAEALDLFQRAQALSEEAENEQRIDIARWSVAKTLRVMGRVEEGLAILRDLESESEPDGFIEEEIAECLLALGEKEMAAAYFKVAYELLSEIDWVAEDLERMGRLKSLASFEQT